MNTVKGVCGVNCFLCLYNTMSTSNEMWWPFCTHHEALHYTLLKQALSVTHAHIYLPHTCNHECSIWENEPVSRIKNI